MKHVRTILAVVLATSAAAAPLAYAWQRVIVERPVVVERPLPMPNTANDQFRPIEPLPIPNTRIEDRYRATVPHPPPPRQPVIRDPGGGPNDQDGDGYSASVDCNDRNRAVYPGAPEIRDGLDYDCDGYDL